MVLLFTKEETNPAGNTLLLKVIQFLALSEQSILIGHGPRKEFPEFSIIDFQENQILYFLRFNFQNKP